MVRTHDKSIFIRLKEAELQNYSGKILQVERIPQMINNWYYCLCEVLPPKVVKEEDELERVTKELKNLCHTILAAIEYDDNDRTRSCRSTRKRRERRNDDHRQAEGK